MGEKRNQLLFRCDECGWVGEELQCLVAPNPFDPLRRISGCPQCKEVERFTNICDEPGCSREAGCGWPGADGVYRRTCGEHMPKSMRA